jgi:hypothetical protein
LGVLGALFSCWRTVLLVFGWRSLLEDCTTGFYLRNLLEFGGLLQGAPVAGSFGLGGQETVRNPGAREPDRLFLAGWEVSQFWAELQAELENNNSIIWRYVFSLLCYVMWFIIMLLINFNSVEYGYMLNIKL